MRLTIVVINRVECSKFEEGGQSVGTLVLLILDRGFGKKLFANGSTPALYSLEFSGN